MSSLIQNRLDRTIRALDQKVFQIAHLIPMMIFAYTMCNMGNICVLSDFLQLRKTFAIQDEHPSASHQIRISTNIQIHHIAYVTHKHTPIFRTIRNQKFICSAWSFHDDNGEFPFVIFDIDNFKWQFVIMLLQLWNDIWNEIECLKKFCNFQCEKWYLMNDWRQACTQYFLSLHIQI